MTKTVIGSVLILICGIAIAQQPVNLPPPTSTGVVVPDRTVTLAAKIVGRVVAVNVDEGDWVKIGDVMVDIGDAELRANLSAAKARLRMEELNWAHQERLAERVRSLREQATVSAENLDDANFKVAAAEQAVASARAEVARARAMLDETKIRAPFDGVIIRKDIETGDVTSPGGPLLVLEDHAILKFRTNVKEQDIPRIEKGQTITVTIDALDDLALDATITKIVPSGDLSTHEFLVEATLPAQDKLYPGMFGKAEFTR
ncbi:MAG: efflux RND transporter periplasmic adaptor subunit [Gammaproteobacteria bacterium]|nr:efflux RND transporter periplasmic adaptor subunit [Gammaproteobacteria bacterium]